MAFFRKSEERQQFEDLELLRQEVLKAKMPSSVEAYAVKELNKLGKTPAEAAEYVIGINHLEYLVSLPWNIHTEDNLDLQHVEKVLNSEHAGLSLVKERILEYLAVRTLEIQRDFRLLVVDDEEITRANLKHILEKEGYEVAAAANGVEALAQMEKGPFDLVLTDLLMLKLGGMELLQQVKDRYPQTDVVIITGYATVPSAVEALQKGAYHYLAKPLKIDEVRSTVSQSLAKRQKMHRPKGPVLCFVGPPGTGKTSLGKSIASAMGRKFIRLALGGMKDEAEIRGHRRSYAGAMPGRPSPAFGRPAGKDLDGPGGRGQFQGGPEEPDACDLQHRGQCNPARGGEGGDPAGGTGRERVDRANRGGRRSGDPQRASPPHLRAVLPRRQGKIPRNRRHRPGARYRQAHRRIPRRNDPGGERVGNGNPVHHTDPRLLRRAFSRNTKRRKPTRPTACTPMWGQIRQAAIPANPTLWGHERFPRWYPSKNAAKQYRPSRPATAVSIACQAAPSKRIGLSNHFANRLTLF